MILFFSGTGNSKHIAKIVASSLGDEITDITPYLKEGKTGDFTSDRPFVFVVPTYSSYIPRIVEKFIKESKFTIGQKAYFLLTCGASCSRPGVVKKIRPLCREKGLILGGVEGVVMPENYITLFAAPSEETAKKIIEKAESKLPPIIEKIRNGEDIFNKSFPTFSTYIVNPIFYKTLVTDKHYYATDACVSCGKCVSLCPINNITLEDGKPVWHGKCTQCMACIGACPAQAIEYGNKAKNKRRYYLS